ncbi:MAG: N-acetylmuramoyl-L-alanine amidase [Candidatus Omnitrophica bacterium]|nr:N-acetylmuramoyl-L-alanine amidase [Candidatus Omnitrophota bacterium]
MVFTGPCHLSRGTVLAVLLGCGSVLSGCASTPPPTTAPRVLPLQTAAQPVSAISSYLPSSGVTPRDIYHEVGPSETLWRISTVYNVNMATLMRVNNITDPTQIKNGQKLLIPNTYGPRPNIPLYPTMRWTHIVIHHTATDEGSAYSINSLHQKRGWEHGMGYDFLVDNGTRGKMIGQIEVGPRWIKQMDGAHTKQGDWNKKSIGIAVVGNYSETGLPVPMMESLVFLVTTLKKFYGIPDQNIVGHRNVPGAATECPGKYFPWSEFKRRIR